MICSEQFINYGRLEVLQSPFAPHLVKILNSITKFQVIFFFFFFLNNYQYIIFFVQY